MTRIIKILGSLALAAGLVAAPTASFAGISIGIGIVANFGPPALPVYVQPPCPAPNLIWTPGYWNYADGGYFWVPGTWVAAPQPGYLWTPGYWGYGNGLYRWNGGYWGPRVGFYGGVNYGFGYFGRGFYGGGWFGNQFRYNTAYANVNRTVINNVYVNRTVINNYNTTTINRVSYNGGPGGIEARPTARELEYRNQGVPATDIQRQHVELAAQNRNQFASVNHGRPVEAAYARPLSEQNRAASLARPNTQTDRAVTQPGVTQRSNDPFSRFDRNPQTNRNVPGNAANPANRPQDRTYGARTEQSTGPNRVTPSYRTPNAYRTQQGTYRAQDAYGARTEQRGAPNRIAPSYRTPNAYRARNAYRPQAVNRPRNAAGRAPRGEAPHQGQPPEPRVR